MTGYYLQLAWQNLRRSPWLTALIIVTIGVGISSSMTTYALLRAMTRDPIPQQAGRLFAPVHTTQRECDGTEPCQLLSWPDAMALRRALPARRRAVMFPVSYITSTEASGSHPFEVRALATDADLFPMFDLRFLKGGPWSAADGAAPGRVVVLTASLAGRLFAGAQPIGRVMPLNGLPYRVVGVVADWLPQPHFHVPMFRHAAAGFAPPDELFVPLEAAVAEPGRAMLTSGRYLCSTSPGTMALRETWMNGSCAWVQLWVELEGAEAVRRYGESLRPGWTLAGVHDFLARYKIVPASYRMEAVAGFAFLAICLVNAIGLMLARFRARGGELRLRRALGASRAALFRQCLVEAAALGIAGGLLGLLLVLAGVGVERLVLPGGLKNAAMVDATVVVGTLLLALGSTVCAGLYPAWRAARAASLARGQAAGLHRLGVVPLAIQIALTSGILANGLHVVGQRVDEMQAQSGLDESDVFTVSTVWNGPPREFMGLVDKDLASLRAMPEVMSAIYGETAPYTNEGYMRVDGPGASGVWSIIYRGSLEGLTTLGVRLLAGRWFETGDAKTPRAVISRKLADSLYPDGDAVGRTMLTEEGIQTVIGVFDYWQNAVFLSSIPAMEGLVSVSGRVYYMVRARPHQLRAAMRAAAMRLGSLDPQRKYTAAEAYVDLHAERMRNISGVVAVLLGVCALQILAIAFGIVGITWYWAQQRRPSIAIRRALGARRGHIVRRFMTENLVIAAIGVAAGLGIALAGNVLLVKLYPGPPLHPLPMLIGAALILLVSQLAVLWPALQASFVPPAAAGRTG